MSCVGKTTFASLPAKVYADITSDSRLASVDASMEGDLSAVLGLLQEKYGKPTQQEIESPSRAGFVWNRQDRSQIILTGNEGKLRAVFRAPGYAFVDSRKASSPRADL